MSGDGPVLTAFCAEASGLTTALGRLPDQAWRQPTRCVPWQVRDVVGHVITVVSRVADALSAPAPDRPDTTATSYYRPDERFSEPANTERVRTAHRLAAAGDGTTLVRDLDRVWRTAATLCRSEPPGRLVRTRHGDAMSLSDFLTTRTVEVALHGLDIADAVHRPPWLTRSAAEQLQQMLFGPAWKDKVAAAGWDSVTLLRKASGRTPVDAEEVRSLDRLGIRWLAFG